MKKVAILGSGMAGWGAAHYLHGQDLQATMYEKESYSGGHTASITCEEGWVFDQGPHVSFTKVERIQKLLADGIKDDYQTLRSRINNHWKGHWIKHPAQCHLYGLPAELIVRCVSDFIKVAQEEPKPVTNYAEWLRQAFGKTFAETFPMEYCLKYHTTHAENLTTDWLGPRFYRPKLEEVLWGALSPVSQQEVHYVTGFRYPTRNGFGAYLEQFGGSARLLLNHEVAQIDTKARSLTFSNSKVETYDQLISSMPLPELISRIAGAPIEVRDAANKLACSTAVLVTVGVNRPDLIDAHWTYFYDRDYFFTRLSTPHLQSPHNAPPGCGLIQAECYYSRKYRPLDSKPEDCVEPVLRDLRRSGLLREGDKILMTHAMLIPYANVIFDHDRVPALKVVHGFLEDVGIAYCGRYGEWGYQWTDEAFMSGEQAAEKTLRRLSV